MPELECPDAETISRWINGMLPPETAEQHEQHFESCAACLETVQRLTPADSLTESLSAGTTLPTNDDPALSELIGKLQELPLAEPGSWASLDIDIKSFLHPPEQEDELGRLGEHRVLEFLGTGGMGIVFKAEDLRLQRMVALKVMHPVLSASRHASRRFQREARAMASFEHEHIVTIYNVGEDRGLPWLSMHLLEGESLQQRLENVDRLAPSETIRIGREIAEGLTAAHERGLLHRDIKPDNIWLRSGDDQVTIVDFGLARVADEGSLLTRQGAILGTPDYMAPEQARGESVDGRCDLFSLGCLLYRMVTGVSPFSRGNAMATLRAVVDENVAPPCEVTNDCSRELSDLIMRLLSKSPGDRPAAAEEVAATLAAMETTTSTKVAAPPMPPNRFAQYLPAGLCGAVLGFVAAFIIQWSTDKGTLVVDIKDNNIAVTMQDEKLLIRDRENGEEFTLRIGENRLPSGDYEILLSSNASQLELSMSEFSLVRGSQKRLTVEWKLHDPPSDDQISTVDVESSAEDVAIGSNPDDTLSWLRSESDLMLPAAGEPLSPDALVQQPVTLPNVASWSIETRQDRSGISAAVLSPDGNTLASAGYDGAIRLSHVATGAVQQILMGRYGPVGSLTFSPDGQYLAAIGNVERDSNVAHLWIWRLGRTTRLIRTRAVPRAATMLAWSPPNGKLLAFQSDKDSAPTLYDWQQDRMLSNFGMLGKISQRPWSSDGRLFATTDGNGLHIWDLQRQVAVHTVPGNALSNAQWSGAGAYIAVLRRTGELPSSETSVPVAGFSSRGGYTELRSGSGSSRAPTAPPQWSVEIWDVDGFHLVKTVETRQQHSMFSWSPTGKYFVSMGSRPNSDPTQRRMGESTFQLFELETGQVFELPKITEAYQLDRPIHLPSVPGMNLFQWSTDGVQFATVTRGKAWVTDVVTRTSQAIAGFNDNVSLYRSSLWGDSLVSMIHGGLGNYDLSAWDLATLKQISFGDWSPEHRWSYSLSPNGKVVATLRAVATRERDRSAIEDYVRNYGATNPFRQGFSRDEVDWELQLWDVTSGKQLSTTMLEKSQTAPTVLWSPDGQRLAFVDGRVRVIHGKTGELVRTFGGTEVTINPPQPCAWSPDGRLIAIAGPLGVQVIDVATGVSRQELKGPVPEGQDPISRSRSRSGDRSGPIPAWFNQDVVWSSNGSRIATIDFNRFRTSQEARSRGASTLTVSMLRVHIWTMVDGKFQFSHHIDLPYETRSSSGGRPRGVNPGLAISPDGQSLAITTTDNQFRIYRLSDSQKVDLQHEVTIDLSVHPYSFRIVGGSRQATTIPLSSLEWIDENRVLFLTGTSTRNDGAEGYGIFNVQDGKLISHIDLPSSYSLAFDGDQAVIARGNQFDLVDIDGTKRASLLWQMETNDLTSVAVSIDGHYRTNGPVNDFLAFVVLTEDGEQLTLTPAEFKKRFDWENEPEKVRLLR